MSNFTKSNGFLCTELSHYFELQKINRNSNGDFSKLNSTLRKYRREGVTPFFIDPTHDYGTKPTFESKMNKKISKSKNLHEIARHI
jgi:hypothetical protein